MRFVTSLYIAPCNYGLQSGLLTAWCGVCRVRYLSSVDSAPCSYVPLSVLFALRIGLSRYVLRPPSSSRSTLAPFAMARNLPPAPVWYLPCTVFVPGVYCSVQLWTSVGIARGEQSSH